MRMGKRMTAILTAAIILIFIGAAQGAVVVIQVTAQSITDAVEDELQQDPMVPAQTIDVSTNDGIITLSGMVGNLDAKERAQRIAGTVKGVVAVINNIRVMPSERRNDQQIENDVKTALLLDPAADSYEVDVAADNGVVTLAGKVDSWQERELAAEVAQGVRGVLAVNNNIAVTRQEKRRDAEIKADIRARLKNDELVDNALIDVKVNNGNVTLSGVVGSSAEKSQAITDAWVTGVETVTADNLQVERWARDPELRGDKYTALTDSDIREGVENALLYNPRVGSYNITTQVNDGVVTLRGKVEDLNAKRAAAKEARNIVGVQKVENRLKVRGKDRVDNQKIEERVSDAFAIDPTISQYEITVNVENGIARLYGTVDSYYEKALADDEASKVNGVVAVDNNLVVTEVTEPLISDPYVDNWYVYDYDWYDYQPGYTFTTDAEIKDEIESEYFWSPFVDGGDINISVQDGTATLTGNVDSWAERYSATENALEGGATWVENELTIE